mmetsp:Transcript_22885/g.53561  ORF Transcript_22885/g.53561 Transcript_22885/m.53561 type:complete len:244 (-) Transcript_22885:49-780(-)
MTSSLADADHQEVGESATHSRASPGDDALIRKGFLSLVPGWARKHVAAILLLRQERLVRLAFFHPVNVVKYPDYCRKIAPNKPVDFSLILRRLVAGEYLTARQLTRDIDMIFANARKYNPPGSSMVRLSMEAEKRFEALVLEQSFRSSGSSRGQSSPEDMLDFSDEEARGLKRKSSDAEVPARKAVTRECSLLQFTFCRPDGSGVVSRAQTELWEKLYLQALRLLGHPPQSHPPQAVQKPVLA